MVVDLNLNGLVIVPAVFHSVVVRHVVLLTFDNLCFVDSKLVVLPHHHRVHTREFRFEASFHDWRCLGLGIIFVKRVVLCRSYESNEVDVISRVEVINRSLRGECQLGGGSIGRVSMRQTVVISSVVGHVD